MSSRFRRVGCSVAAVVLGVGLSLIGAASPAAADVSPLPARDGPIQGIANKCVDVAGGATTDGTALQLNDCNGTGAQQWHTNLNGTITALGKCMDVAGGATAEGTQVRLWVCNGTPAQQWQVSDRHQLVNVRSAKCLDTTGGGSANLTGLQISQCGGGSSEHFRSQMWHLPYLPWLVTDQVQSNLSLAAPKCIDDDHGRTANGTHIQMWDCIGSPSQQWTAFPDGSLRVYGKCLTAITTEYHADDARTPFPGAKAQLSDCVGASWQQWYRGPNDSLVVEDTGFCLDDPLSNAGNGTQLQIWTCNGTDAQRWNAPIGNGAGTLDFLGLVRGGSGHIAAILDPTAILRGGRQVAECVDDPGGDETAGTQLQLWDCVPGNGNQEWTIWADGSLRHDGMCLDVPGGGTAEGTPVQLLTCTNAASQRWRINGGLMNMNSGLCLDAVGDSYANGTLLQIWECNTSTNLETRNQLWLLPPSPK
jgi:ricin-type beta-trefoil lectin protein